MQLQFCCVKGVDENYRRNFQLIASEVDHRTWFGIDHDRGSKVHRFVVRRVFEDQRFQELVACLKIPSHQSSFRRFFEVGGFLIRFFPFLPE